MKTSNFHVMTWLREIREKQAAALQGKTPQERAAYYRRKAQEIKNKLSKEKLAA